MNRKTRVVNIRNYKELVCEFWGDDYDWQEQAGFTDYNSSGAGLYMDWDISKFKPELLISRTDDGFPVWKGRTEMVCEELNNWKYDWDFAKDEYTFTKLRTLGVWYLTREVVNGDYVWFKRRLSNRDEATRVAYEVQVRERLRWNSELGISQQAWEKRMNYFRGKKQI